MTDRRLSIVIPAHNEEALIGEVVEAVLVSVARASGVARKDLWLPNTSFEVVVADDGSEDGTAAIVEKFAAETGVRLVSCVGGTCAAARNAGAAVLLVSTDLEEVFALSDRILVMSEGRIVYSQKTVDANIADVGRHMAGWAH